MRTRLVVPLLISLVVVGCGGGAGQPEGGFPPTAVQTAIVQSQEVRASSEYVAQIRSRNSIDVQPQIDGHVTKIFVRPGDRVSASARLMQIDPQRQLQTVRGSEASRNARVAALRLAEQQKARAEGLFRSGVMSRQEYDQAESALSAAQADVANVDAQVSADKVQLRYYDIVAPAAGIVGDIPVREGDLVSPSTRLTTLDQNAGLEAYIPVPIERASALHPGLDVELLDESGNLVERGKIDFIAPRASEATQSLLVKAPVANGAKLRTSQFTRARIIWSAHAAPVVPTTAVVRFGGQAFVFVVESDGKQLVAHQKPVELGELTDGMYELRSGVKEGQKVVVSGTQKLRDGAPVQPESATPPTASAGGGR
jgi:RND family efflux transporter MFP subunit